MSDQDGRQATALPRPTTDDTEAWKAYWQAQGQPWRIKPEIDTERQKELDDRRKIVPDIQQGIYPFKGMKLSRADVEWLLATHENGRGPVDWNDKSQRVRNGLDLRGADLRRRDMRNLPLARTLGGLTSFEWVQWSEEQRNMANIHVEEAILNESQLQGAYLRGAQLQEAYLIEAHLEEAELRKARLERVDLYGAYLEGADLRRAHLEGADLRGAQLQGVDLEEVTLSNEKHISPRLADVHWTDVNLAIIDWSTVKILGDEHEAQQSKDRDRQINEYQTAVRANRQLAVALQAQGLNENGAYFAYRAQVLQKSVLWYQMTSRHQLTQSGLQQVRVPFRQRLQALGPWLFSWFLFLLAGYGYRVRRSFAAYVLVIGGFAIAYYLLGLRVGLQLSYLDAIVFSMTSFHGRGFSPGENIGLSNPLTILAAIEAFVGLVIEVTLIATLTQRFFGK